jgi:hypothetical protein
VQLPELAERLLQVIEEDGAACDGPPLILAFDEAHTLMKPVGTKPDWSRYSALQRTLQALRDYPIWSIFLSTAGKITQFVPLRHLDPLAHVQPFSALGFDVLATKISEDDTLDLNYVASLPYKVRLGRPL